MKRSRDEIIVDILKVAKAGVKKTRIVYGANLNFLLIRRYLGELTKAGLIEKIDGLWKTTKRGLHYLEGYRSLRMEFGL